MSVVIRSMSPSLLKSPMSVPIEDQGVWGMFWRMTSVKVPSPLL